MSGVTDSIKSFSSNVSSVVDTGRGWVDDLSGALDFGDAAPPQQTTPTSQARELDIQEIDRANPTNTNFSGPFGLPMPVVYGVGALVTLVVLKKFKVI